MKRLLKWIRSEVDVEFMANVHGMSMVLVSGFLGCLIGRFQMDFLVIFEMVMLGYGIAWFQKLLFLRERVYKKREFTIRSVLWTLGPMLFTGLAQWLFGWFLKSPAWLPVAFLLLMLCYHVMMWAYVQIFYREDSAELNRMLEEFKTRREKHGRGN